MHDTLLADWVGEQTEATVMDGCEKILKFLTDYHCVKLLNDNILVTGLWSDAAQWVALNWVPRMVHAGCRFIAHVYSPDIFAKLSVHKAIEFRVKGVMVTTFHGRAAAR